MLHVKANRLERLRDEDDPRLEETAFDAPHAGDNELPPHAVVATLGANAKRLAMLAGAMPAARWATAGRRNGAIVGPEHLLDEAVHRAAHNLHDARLVLALAALHPSRLASRSTLAADN